MLFATASAAAFDRSSTGRIDDVVAHADAAVLARYRRDEQSRCFVSTQCALQRIAAVTTAWS